MMRPEFSSDHSKYLSPTPLCLSPHWVANHEPISQYLWGGFIEHLGRCVYGGIIDSPTYPSPPHLLIPQDEGRLGWRRDIVKLLAKEGELEMPMIRWPGGNFVSNYHWLDGVGPIPERKNKPELAWNSSEPNLYVSAFSSQP